MRQLTLFLYLYASRGSFNLINSNFVLQENNNFAKNNYFQQKMITFSILIVMLLLLF